ncbi:hypothetical protein GCM10027521_34750 [Amycolatopsis cihanbeyliensis]
MWNADPTPVTTLSKRCPAGWGPRRAPRPAVAGSRPPGDPCSSNGSSVWRASTRKPRNSSREAAAGAFTTAGSRVGRRAASPSTASRMVRNAVPAGASSSPAT